MKLSEKIFIHRKRMGLSQEELAARLGVTRQAVSKWEQGASVPELGTILPLAKTFGVTTDYLLSEEDPVPQQSPFSQTPPPEREAYPDWLKHLPRSLRQMVLRYGWLGGVYLGGIGLLTVLLGAFVRYQSRQMLGGIDMELMFPGYRHPMNSMATLVQVIGGIQMFAGIALALWLRHKGKQDK